MKRAINFLIILAVTLFAVKAQNKPVHRYELYENTVVKDSSGTVYPFNKWQRMVLVNGYALKPVNAADAHTAYIIYKNRVSTTNTDEKPNQIKKGP